MREYSYIETSVQTNNLGMVEKREYKWMGESPYITLDARFVSDLGYNEIPKEIEIGQFKLVLVEKEPYGLYIKYIKKSGFYWARLLCNPLSKMIDLAYRRFIVTLAVWNLARFSRGTIPTWRDIKIFKR